MTKSKLTHCFFFVLFIYLFFFQAYMGFPFTTDDAFISLRYATHLAGGKGLVWNNGELPVEGYSNFLFVIIESLLVYLHLPVIFFIKIFSLLSLFVSACVLYAVSRCWLPRMLSCLPPLLMLFHRGEIVWAVSGLETSFYQCLIVLTVYCLVQGVTQKIPKFFMYGGLLMALAGLTRPEAPLLFIGFFIILIIFSGQVSPDERRFYYISCKRYLLSFLTLYLPYFMWKLYYFARLFPNPVYCKAFFSAVPGFLDVQYLLLVCPLLVFSIPQFIEKCDKRYLFLLFPSVFYLVALINGEVLVAYFHRHFLNAFILLLPLFVGGIYTLCSSPAMLLKEEARQYLTVFIVLLLGLFLIPSYLPIGNYAKFARISTMSAKQRREVGQWLKVNVKEGEKVTVGDCGLIPYTYGGPVIDTYCLNSSKMTRSPISLSYPRFIDWILADEKPRYIILLALTQKGIAYAPPFEQGILRRDAFHASYQKHQHFMVGDNLNGYYYDVYKRSE